MKKPIVISIAVFVLVIGSLLFLRQAIEAQSAAIAREESILFNSLVGVTEVLNETPEVLDLYREDFSEEEGELFREALEGVKRTSNQIHGTLNHLYVGDLNWHRAVYQQGLLPIREVVEDIQQGKIHSKDEVQEIGEILKEQGSALSHIFFEEAIGIEGLYERENQDRIITILEEANSKIEEVR